SPAGAANSRPSAGRRSRGAGRPGRPTRTSAKTDAASNRRTRIPLDGIFRPHIVPQKEAGYRSRFDLQKEREQVSSQAAQAVLESRLPDAVRPCHDAWPRAGEPAPSVRSGQALSEANGTPALPGDSVR